MQEMWVQSLGVEDPLEKEMATHSSTLAWIIPRTEEPGRLQSMGSRRVRRDWSRTDTQRMDPVFWMPGGHRFQWHHATWELSETQSKHKVKGLL